MSKLLINEPPLQFLPTLAVVLGGERRAIALQQLHYMLGYRRLHVTREGRRWVKANYAEWHAEWFKCWSPDVVRKLFSGLRADGYVLHRQFDIEAGDATSYLSIDYAFLEATHPDEMAGWHADDLAASHPDKTVEDHPDDLAASTYSEKKSNKKESVRATRVRARAADPRSAHPAIVLTREVASRFPPRELYDTVISVLGDAPDEVKLTACRRAWLTRGYNAASWVWLVEWYAGGIPQQHGAGGGNGGQAGRPDQPLASDSWRDAFRMAGMDVDADAEVADGQ